jgi:excisionase family DNA binding protein
MAEKDEVLLTSQQAAEILNLSPDSVNDLARRQVLPGIKRGRQWRFRQRDVVVCKRQIQEQVSA